AIGVRREKQGLIDAFCTPRFRMGLPTVSPLSGRRSIESETIEICGAQITCNLRSHLTSANELTISAFLRNLNHQFVDQLIKEYPV
ncbi:MAG: hypothetical protein JW941_01720, partial [Candidatus Coatesbacteria bacterium]|nr:hypothetical protein [Candidatus Coatesbacteria bacterium]